MTLIACTINHKVPFLTSDILMSSLTGNDKFSVPTNNFDVQQFLKTDGLYKPDSFAQKMYIVKENVCIVFAGAEEEIKEFLREIRQRCSYTDSVTNDYIKTFLDEYALRTAFSNSACFIIVVEHTGPDSIYVGMFNFPKKMSDWKNGDSSAWRTLQNDIYDTVYATGSGRDRFLNLIDQPVNFDTKHPKGSIWYALQTNVSLIARLLALEKVNLYTLEQNWGGGFETAFYNGTSFEKISDVVYVAAYKQFDVDGEIDVPFPQLFLYYKYFSSRLRIVAVEVNRAKKEVKEGKIIITSDAPDFEVRCFDVDGLDGVPAEATLPDDLSFKTDSVSVGYSLIGPDNSIFNPSWFNRHPELSVTFQHNKSIELVLSQEVNDLVRAQCQQYFQRSIAGENQQNASNMTE